MEDDFRQLDRRVGLLETRDAVRLERDVHIDRRFDRLEAMQKDTQGTLNRLGWLIISAVILAALTALVSGGLPPDPI
jgi:hypothetical protein